MANESSAADIDAMAATLTRAIMSKPDYREHEYVAVVHQDADGNLATTDFYTSGKEACAPLGKALTAAGGPEHVLAVVHNHPPSIIDVSAPGYGRSAEQINKIPSNNDGSNTNNIFKYRTDVDYCLAGPDDDPASHRVHVARQTAAATPSRTVSQSRKSLPNRTR